MRRDVFSLGATLAMLASGLTLAAPVATQTFSTDDPVLRRLWVEGMENSQAYPLAQALFDSIGPRLTGSPNLEAGHDWLLEPVPELGGRSREAGLRDLDAVAARAGACRSRGAACANARGHSDGLESGHGRSHGPGRGGEHAGRGERGRVRGLATERSRQVRHNRLPAADLPTRCRLGALGDGRVLRRDAGGAQRRGAGVEEAYGSIRIRDRGPWLRDRNRSES